jgi:hypothetical protein
MRCRGRFALPPAGGGRPRRSRRSLLSAGARNLLPALLLGLTACSDTFDPIDHSGPPFSIFGVLDASADTQWIRVNGLRSTLLPSTAPSGFAVTLENLGQGRVIQLRDSAMPFVNMLGSEPAYAHDFWTAERLQPGASYRFRARADSAVAESIVEIPRDFQWEVWVSQPVKADRPFASTGPDIVWLAGVKQLAFLVWYRPYWDDCSAAAVDRTVNPMGAGGDSVARQVGVAKDTISVKGILGRSCGALHYTNKELDVVSSGAPWPFGLDYTTWQLKPGDEASNVSNSFGFIGGVLTRRLPYERCEFADTTAERYCKLRYDSTTATLRGTVASACPFPPDSLRIALREIGAVPSEGHRIRRPYHDQAGNYEIGALRPGIPHVLSITGGVGTWAWSWYTDTLTLAPGQHASHHATLSWEGTCPWQ